MTRIVARGLGKRFGRTVGLDGIELDLAPGRSLAVLGANGAGKSTLLRLMAGLSRPTSGSLEIGGVAAQRSEARARVGFISHASHLYPDLTARENLVFAARIYTVADPHARAAELLAEENLEPAADRPTRAFSRGMAQRLAIARGLVHRPEIVLLDEPFTGLDHRSADRLRARIGTLRERGSTLVLVTHDVEQAAELADSAIVLGRGRINYQAPDAQPLNTAALEQACRDASDALAPGTAAPADPGRSATP